MSPACCKTPRPSVQSAASAAATSCWMRRSRSGMSPIDVAAWHVDLLAAPGHKGLHGPLGTGLLYVGERAEPVLQPLMRGGTGTASEKAEQPWPLPDRLESGNQNTPAIAGLLAGVQSVLEKGVTARHRHDARLTDIFARAVERARVGGRGRDPRTKTRGAASRDRQSFAARVRSSGTGHDSGPTRAADSSTCWPALRSADSCGDWQRGDWRHVTAQLGAYDDT